MFVIKQNDTLPYLEVVLYDCNGDILNLDLCGVTFNLIGEDFKISRNVDDIVPDEGKVIIKFKENETMVAGIYYGEFKVNMPDGEILSVPNDSYFRVGIVKDLISNLEEG